MLAGGTALTLGQANGSLNSQSRGVEDIITIELTISFVKSLSEYYFCHVLPWQTATILDSHTSAKGFHGDSRVRRVCREQQGNTGGGKLGDLAVLSQDIPTVPSADLPKTESVLTYGGRKDSLCKRGIRPTLGFQLQRPTDAPNISVLSSRQSER